LTSNASQGLRAGRSKTGQKRSIFWCKFRLAEQIPHSARSASAPLVEPGRPGARLPWEATDQAPWVDFARNRIVLPAEMVKAVEDQWVPLDPALRAALDALPRQGRKVFRFTAPDGHPVSAGALSDRVALLAKRAGVRLTFHSLRKGFGCRHAGRVPAQVLQRLMRHANIATSMAFYANIDAAVEEAILGPKDNGSRNRPAEQHGPEQSPDVLSLVPRDDSDRLRVAN